MRIEELILENFAPILAGTGKERIHINLRDSRERINVFIGKIGSGKTYILSHLQPFSTVGTLDVRNNDDPIIKEKDGLKVIVYSHMGHEYVITHKYTWTGTTHSKKSYVEKDGIELNPNGNRNTFEEIIELEFGINPSFLRLIRLGPNVINFIDMKATERKAYIASLLSETEFYLLLHKHWSQELRNLNTSASVLMNRLNVYGKKPIDEYEEDLEELEEAYNLLNHVIEELTQKKFALEAENKTLAGNLSRKDFLEKGNILQNDIELMKHTKDELDELLKTFEEYPSITEVSRDIGKYDSLISSYSEKINTLEKRHDEISKELNNKRSVQAISCNKDHMISLKKTYNDLILQEEKYRNELRGFKCSYSSAFLTGFMEDLNLVNMLIDELLHYDSDIVKKLYNSDSSAITYAKKQIEILEYRKLKLQKMINNLRFSETYEPLGKLYLPPFCPTKSCPFYATHPSIVQKKIGKNSSADEEIIGYQTEIQDIDVEIYKYSDYSLIYSKLTTLKGYWNKMRPILKTIGALRCDNLLQIVTTGRYEAWYNYDKIVDTIDMIEKKDKHASLLETLKDIKSELNELEMNQDNSIEDIIASLEIEKKNLEEEIEELEKKRNDATTQLKSYNDIYVILSDKSTHEMRHQEIISKLNIAEKELVDYLDNKKKIEDNFVVITSMERDLLLSKEKLSKLSEEIDATKTKINDMKYTSEELNRVLQEQKWMSYMVDAVSSKKGIPLVMVQLFLESCKDIINDMLYFVCEDNIEILEFDITENEFKIPYMINGQKIDDISKASQGQTSIVSTVMSFALVQKTGSLQYNIPLLDEMDAPLHKNEKQKFIAILFKYLDDIHSEQSFLITHDENVFTGYPVQVIMTTDEVVNQDTYKNVIHV